MVTVGKKLSIYYITGFVVLFIVMIVQIIMGGVNPFLLFSLCGVIIFLGGTLYERKLASEMFDNLKSYYRNDLKSEQHMRVHRKFGTAKFIIGMIFLASAAVCIKSSYSSFGEYVYALQMPKSVAGIIAVLLGNLMYHLAEKLYSNQQVKAFPGGISAFKASCAFVIAIGLVFLGI